MRMFKPSSLHEAYCLAKLQEATLASLARKKLILERPPAVLRSFNIPRGSVGDSMFFSSQRYSGRNNAAGSHVSARGATSSTGSVTSKPRKILTPKEKDEKRVNGMCFFCDEKYHLGHKCAGQVYSLKLMEDEGCEEGQEEEDKEEGGRTEPQEEQPLISPQALQGMNSFQTMRVGGKVGSQTLHILMTQEEHIIS